MTRVRNQLVRGCRSQEPPTSYLPCPFASPNPRYPHPRQRPVTLRSNSNPRRKHIYRGERVLGIVESRSQPRKRTRNRRRLPRVYRRNLSKLDSLIRSFDVVCNICTWQVRSAFFTLLLTSFPLPVYSPLGEQLSINRRYGYVRSLSKLLLCAT